MLTALSIGAAAFPSLRIELGSLLIPMHVIPVLLALPVVVPAVSRVGSRLLAPMAIFFGLFALAVVRHGSELGDLVKMSASFGIMLTAAVLVKRRTDFVIGVAALSLAILVVNARGLQGGFVDYIGYEPLRGIANKNAYSLYSLPAFLLAAFALLHFPLSLTGRAIHATCIFSTVFILFTGANRSGWAGVVLIALMLAAQARRWKAIVVISILGGASYAGLQLLGTTSTFEYRVEQTTSGYLSDDLREDLLLAAVDIALDEPVLGVTPQKLPFELAKRTAAHGDAVDPHNFLAYILAGCGFLVTLALFALGLALWRRPPSRAVTALHAHDLVRMVLILFVVRGFFSREAFFVASFPMALGLALGLMLTEQAPPASPDPGAASIRR